MGNELRYDRGQAEIVEKGDGFLRVKVVFAKIGVFPYLTPSGDIRYEAKLPEDLLSELTINSAKGAPVTDDHPPVGDNDGMVNTSNWKAYIKGTLGDEITVIENQKLEAVETIYDANLIADLEAGKKIEVSIGFKTKLDHTPGVFEGEKYDVKQTEIIINHIAHVEEGRAGEDVRAYLDSANGKYAVQIEEGQKKNKSNTRRDSKMTLDEIRKKIAEIFGFKFESDSDDDEDKDTKNDDQNDDDDDVKNDDDDEDKDTKNDDDDEDDDKKTDSKDIKKLKKRLKKAEARADAAEALIKKLGSVTKKHDAAIVFDKAVNRRIQLIETAKAIVPDFKYDGMNERNIMLKVIENTLPFDEGTKLDKKDDVYIEARFDAALAYAKSQANYDIGNSNSSNRIDASAINEKKQKRLNWMKEADK